MKKRNFMRIGALTMAMVLSLSGLGNVPSVHATSSVDLSTIQMTSQKEDVYLSLYGASGERTENFDSNWKFYLGDAGEAQAQVFDDSKWRDVSLPHDYSIEQPYSSGLEAESAYLPGGTGWYRKNFTVDSDLQGKRVRIDFGGVYMNSTVWINGHQLGTHPYGYTPFSYDITDYLNFEGDNVIAVKVDHKTPSSRWYSGSGIYRSVNLTITEDVHVDLFGTQITTPNLKAQQGGNVTMEVATTVVNKSDSAANVTLTHTVFPKDGTIADKIGTVTTTAQQVPAGASAEIEAEVTVNNPTLWGLENPQMYVVRTEIKDGDTVLDSYDTDYGFRYTEFDKDTGFSLNGEKMKLKGVCMHHDQGALGSEAHARAIERQVEILKEMGCNSIRVTHNPAADALIEAANKHGMLIIDEAFDGWVLTKNGNSNDYAKWFEVQIEDGNEIIGKEEGMTWAEFDIKAMVKRGRNHPSTIMWSIGNEVLEGTSYGRESEYPAIAEQLVDWAQEEDTSRWVTIGDNKLKAGQQSSFDMGDKIHEAGGIVGANYCNAEHYDAVRSRKPEWFLVGSETASAITSRGVYHRTSGGGQTADKVLTSYDNSKVGWGAVASSAWYEVITRDYLSGEYVWTGFDYIGEPTPWNGVNGGAQGQWESPKHSYFGIIDTAGFPKDSYYLYQSLWNENVNTLHVLPAWNRDVVSIDGSGNVPVVVYSDAAAVELFFTPQGSTQKQSLGKKEFTEKTTAAGYTYQLYEGSDKQSDTHKNLYLTWNVRYAEGTLEAVAYDKEGNVIADTEGNSMVTTTGEEAKLVASVDRSTIQADGKDLAYITVDVTDAEGNMVPDAANNVTFEVEGDGVLVGIDNGEHADHQSYYDNNRDAFRGKVLAIVQSTQEGGEFTVTATADNLTPATVTVQTEEVQEEVAGNALKNFRMERNYYVKTGNLPQLPDTLEAVYTDGTSKELAVQWEEISEEQVQETGTFSVKGTAGSYSVSVIINMIDEVAALLSYSSTTGVGVVPTLPEARQAVLMDGSTTAAAFAVEWEEPEASVYDNAGNLVEIPGYAVVFGEEIPVTATIRVQEEEITVGSSISNAALTLGDNIPEELSDGDISVVGDAQTSMGAGAYWSNKNFVAAGNTSTEIEFSYATQQRFSQFVLHFAKGENGMAYPAAGKVAIEISEDGSNWTPLTAKETIGTEANNVKTYTYDFKAVIATFVKFKITSAGTSTYEALTEAELKLAESSGIKEFSTTALEKLVVNGRELSAYDLEAGSYNTEAILAEVEAVAKDNAAITVLPAYNNEILILLEAENHKKWGEYRICLNKSASESAAPDFAGRDYPVGSLTATADSQYGGTGDEGPANLVLDNLTNTRWHTNYDTNEATNVEKRFIQLNLAEATMLDALRCLPRGGNGDVTSYKVMYRATEDGEWKEISSGDWTRGGQQWQVAVFREPVLAKQVRLIGVHTYADSGNDKHMSIAELRVRRAPEGKIDFTEESNNITVEIAPKVQVGIVNATYPAQPEVVVTHGEEVLRYGMDYRFECTNNTTEGKATVQVVGIADYTGRFSGEFEIELVDAVASVEPQSIQVEKGKTQELQLTVTPENLKDWGVSWTSSNPSIARVNNGVVRGVAAGTAVITATTVDGTKVQCNVTVTLVAAEQEVQAAKAALETLVATAQGKKQKDYTKETWASFATALQIAQNCLKDANATKAALESAKTALQTAMNHLKAPAASGDNSGTTNPPAGGTTKPPAGGTTNPPASGNQAAIDREAAAAVVNGIASLKNVNLASEAQLRSIREAYNKLTDQQKKLVTNLSILTSAESTLAELKKEAANTAKPGTEIKSADGTYKYKITSTTEAAFVGVTKTVKTVKIANTVTYNGKQFKVTSIANKALKGDTTVTAVTLGTNVKSIGTSAFEGCTKLKKITFKNKLVSIGTKAFKKCTSLTKVTIPKNVTTIGKSAFEGCSKLATITIKATKLKSVKKNVFKGIKATAKIKVGKKNLKAYQKLLKNKGQGKKVKITK